MHLRDSVVQEDNSKICQDFDGVLKAFLLYTLTLFGTTVLIIFSIRAFLSKDFILGTIEIIFSLISIANLLYYKYSGNYRIVSRIAQILLALLLLMLTFYEKRLHSGLLLWYHSFPLAVIFLSGKKEGIVWTLSLIIIAFGVMSYKTGTYSEMNYPNLFLLRFIFSFIVCTGLAYAFEFAREESHKKYRIQNIQLNQSQNLLKESQENLQMILNSMRDIIFTVDATGIIVKYFMPNVKSNLINIPEDYIGNDFRNMLPDHIASQLEYAIKKIEHGEESSEFEYYTGTQNYKNWFSAKVSKIVNNENIARGYLIVARNITRRKEEEEKRVILEGKLMRSEQSATLGRIAAGFAHEIKNPASTVMSDLEIVKKILSKLTTLNEQRKLMSLTQRSLNAIFRITNIVTAIRSSFRRDEWHITDLNDEIDIQLILLQPSIKKRIKIIKKYVPFAKVRVYGNEIGQVILNLLTNSVDSIKDRGQIEIITQDKGYFIIICIKDTGMGIADNILPHIFNPFFTTKHSGKGTGLGLYTSMEIARKYSGRLYVSETAVGKGTTFNFEVLKEAVVNEKV